MWPSRAGLAAVLLSLSLGSEAAKGQDDTPPVRDLPVALDYNVWNGYWAVVNGTADACPGPAGVLLCVNYDQLHLPGQQLPGFVNPFGAPDLDALANGFVDGTGTWRPGFSGYP